MSCISVRAGVSCISARAGVSSLSVWRGVLEGEGEDASLLPADPLVSGPVALLTHGPAISAQFNYSFLFIVYLRKLRWKRMF